MARKLQGVFKKTPRRVMLKYLIMSVMYEGANTLEYISQMYSLEDERPITIRELERWAKELKSDGLLISEEKTKEYFLTQPGREYFELNHHQNQY